MTITTTCVPVWTDNLSVLVPPTVLKSSVHRVVLDLSAKVGADVVMCVGVNAATALGASEQLYMRIRKMLNNKTQSIPGGSSYVALGTTAPTTAAMIATTQVAQTVAPFGIKMVSTHCTNLGTVGNKPILLSGHSGVVWSNMTNGDATSYTAAEFAMLAMAQVTTSANRPALTNTDYSYGIFLDAPCKNSRLANELVVNGAEIWGPQWLPNGYYELIWDASNIQANVALMIAAYHRTYDSDVSTT